MMKRPASVFVIVMFLISMVILPGTPAAITHAAAQEAKSAEAVQLDLAPAAVRSMDQMLADQATQLLPAGPTTIPFRPGMDPAEYDAAKAAAAAAEEPKLVPAAPAAPAPALFANCNGINEFQAGFGFAFFPPDADGVFGFSRTAGMTEFVQTTNVHVTVWGNVTTQPCAAVVLLDIPLNFFFGYFNTFLFDARVVHDDTYQRWVISAEGFQEFPTFSQFQFIAVSVSDDARGPYFIYQFDTSQLTCAGCFWDFPQLGMDDQAVILTANVFGPIAFDSRWVFLNKQRLYFGLGLTSCYFANPLMSWAPPKVLDFNPRTFMLEAEPISNNLFGVPGLGALRLAGLEGTGRVCPRIVSYDFVFVPGYHFPRNAPQPGTNQTIETLDARFQNRSTQVGNLLWNVHTINLGTFPGGFSEPIVRRVNTVTRSAQSSFVIASGSSFDFNPSIAANLGNSAAVSYSSTIVGEGGGSCPNAPASGFAQVRILRFDGAAGLPGFLGGGGCVFQSTAFLTGNPRSPTVQRWGDYSYATINESGSAWGGVNEYVVNPGTWGTRFFLIFP